MVEETKVALVVGAAGGIGSAVSVQLANAGYRIAMADLHADRLADVVRGFCERGWEATAFAADIARTEDCETAVARTVAWGSRLDVVVNAAGVWLEGDATLTTEDEWDRTMGVNLKGCFFVMRSALTRMTHGGVIINIASDAGLAGNKGAAVYSASKGGLVLLVKALALEFAEKGIRINAICPADVATPMLDYQAERYGGGDPEGYKRRLLTDYPQGGRARFVEAFEVAALVAFLCEDYAAAITGSAMTMDFGLTAGY